MKKFLAVLITVAMLVAIVPCYCMADDVDDEQMLNDAQGNLETDAPNIVIPTPTTVDNSKPGTTKDKPSDPGELTPEEIIKIFEDSQEKPDELDNNNEAAPLKEGIWLYINDKLVEFGENDVKPQIINDRTLVPLRIVSENLGAAVNYEQKDGKDVISVTKDGFSLTLTIDEKTAVVNGSEIPLDVPPMLINDRTMVPFRFIFEQFGMEVEYTAPTSENPATVIKAY